ncbi:MAG: TonB-dependent receptor [Flavobacteriales bacterium]|nr:TonB-dependent receptor [Flavobacteriales bacterium]
MSDRTVFLFGALLFAVSANSQASLKGSVLDGNGQGLPFASIRVGDPGFTTQADADGAFTITGLKTGAVRIRMALMGYMALDTSVITGEALVVLRPRSQQLLLRDVEVSALRVGDRAPFPKSTMSSEDIATRNTGVDLPFLLELQPNVVSTSDGGTGIGYTSMRVRGTDATRTNITVNGVPFNDAESQGAFLVNMPDLATSAEDIEVQRGVGTSTNGPAAFGATVNVRTTSVRQEAWGQLAASGGSFNTKRFSASAGTGLINSGSKAGPASFSLDVRLSSITSDGYIDRATADLKSYFLQAAWVGAKRSLRFITFTGKEITYQAWNSVPRDVIDTNRTWNEYTYDNQVDNYEQSHYQLLYDQKIFANATLNITLFRVDGAGYYEQFRTDDDLEGYSIAPIIFGNDTITTSNIVRRRWLDNTLLGGNVATDIKFGKHRLVLGGSYSDYRGDHFGEVIWAQWAGSSNIGDRYYDNRATKTDGNVYGKITYAMYPRVDLFADVQMRRVTHEFLGYDDDFTNIAQSVSYTFFNPKAGVVWRLHEGGKAYASVAIANREPNRDDLTETTPQSRPRSERLADYEVGYERRTGRCSFSANGYFMDYVDQLVNTGELNDVGAALRTNVASSYRVGLELSSAIRITDRLLWNANAAFSRNRVRSFTEFVDNWDTGAQQAAELGETDIAFSPAVVVGSELGFRFWKSPAKGHASITLVSKYVGEQFLDNTSNSDRKLDAYVTQDVRLNILLTGCKGVRSIDFNLTARNVLSELYESNGWAYSYFSEGRRQALVGLFPQAPVNVLGGVCVNF